MPDATKRIVVGRIVAAHGIRGWLKVASFTEPPEAMLEYGHWQLLGADGTAREVTLRDAEWDAHSMRIALEGIEERNAAELLRGLQITVPRSELPATAEREYYREDLLGFAVRNSEGVELGTVSHFVDAPAQPLMVVVGTKEHWIPAQPPHLRRVDLQQRWVLVDWPADL